jgi:hypothetical protein
MGIDHGGPHVAVAEQFLHGADVVAVFEEVGGEAVAIMPFPALSP